MLNGNPQYQNAIISPIKVPNSSPTSNVAYTQVLALFPFSNNPIRNIFHGIKMKEQRIATIELMQPYIYPSWNSLQQLQLQPNN